MLCSFLSYSKVTQLISINPNLLIYLSLQPFPIGNHKFCVLSLWVYFCFVTKFICIIFFFLDFIIHDITWCLSLSDFTQCDNLCCCTWHCFILSMAEWYSIVYMYCIFLTHFSVDGHLGCLRVSSIVNSAAVNIGVHISFHIRIFVFSGSIFKSIRSCGNWTILVAQLVKNLPAMQETLVWFLGREDPLEKG